MSIIRKEFYRFINVFLNTLFGLSHIFIRFPSELSHVVVLCDNNLDKGRVVPLLQPTQAIFVELVRQLLHLAHVGYLFFSIDRDLNGLNVGLELVELYLSIRQKSMF